MKIIIYGVGRRSKYVCDMLCQKYSAEDILGFTQTKFDESLKILYGKPVYRREDIKKIFVGGV